MTMQFLLGWSTETLLKKTTLGNQESGQERSAVLREGFTDTETGTEE